MEEREGNLQKIPLSNGHVCQRPTGNTSFQKTHTETGEQVGGFKVMALCL